MGGIHSLDCCTGEKGGVTAPKEGEKRKKEKEREPDLPSSSISLRNWLQNVVWDVVGFPSDSRKREKKEREREKERKRERKKERKKEEERKKKKREKEERRRRRRSTQRHFWPSQKSPSDPV